jgi:hypothetical protein
MVDQEIYAVDFHIKELLNPVSADFTLKIKLNNLILHIFIRDIASRCNSQYMNAHLSPPSVTNLIEEYKTFIYFDHYWPSSASVTNIMKKYFTYMFEQKLSKRSF